MKRLILVALMVTASWTSGAMALAGESPYGDDPVEIVRGTTSNTLEILNERRAEFEADPSGLHELVRRCSPARREVIPEHAGHRRADTQWHGHWRAY